MKKFILTFLLTISLLAGQSQSFNLAELINMTKMNIDNFDTYVSNKGFKFMEIKEADNIKGIVYAYNQSEYSKKADKFITLYYKYFGENNKNVTFQTGKTIDYLNIKNQIKQLQFNFKKTEIHEGATFLIYTKGNYELSLISFQSDDGLKSTNYEISLTIEN
jgi:hypothetical protein